MPIDPCPVEVLRRTNGWSIRLDDGIALLNPQGKLIPLAYRKVGELLVTLLRTPGRASPRGNLGAVLWPTSGAATQTTNLRQAIKNLRDAIGAENVAADRFDCGLADTFLCSIDAQIESDQPPDWLRGWLSFLEALSYSSPEQFFGAIQANIDLICDLPTPQLSVLVDRAASGLRSPHGMDGWKSFVLGSMSLGEVPKANSHFLAAAKHSANAADSDLFSRSAFWLSACEILRGRIERADELATEALSSAKRRSAPNESRLSAARATAFLHMGRFAESRDIMAGASVTEGTTVFEHDQREALRAFYLATSGYEGEAMRLIENLRRNSTHHSSGRVGILTDLASVAVEAACTPRLVVETIDTRIRTLKAAGQHHFALYAIETLVSALARCNLQQEARTKFLESRRIRRQLGITYSAWDMRRLAPFVVA